MPLVGLLLGREVADLLGSHSNLLAAILLGVTGIYTMFSAIRYGLDEAVGTRSSGTARLLATGVALSVDNLVVGFALGTYHVSLAVAAAVVATVSVVLSLVGLELGGRLGAQRRRRSELLGGALVIAVGVQSEAD
jgi:putative Mn2+ efflux pump MntP